MLQLLLHGVEALCIMRMVLQTAAEFIRNLEKNYVNNLCKNYTWRGFAF